MISDEFKHLKMRGIDCHNIYSNQLLKEIEAVSRLKPINTNKEDEMEGYKERMKIEYYETKTRYDKLHKMINRYEAGTLDFTPKCGIDLLKKQQHHMGMYLNTLEIRAEIEGVDLI